VEMVRGYPLPPFFVSIHSKRVIARAGCPVLILDGLRKDNSLRNPAKHGIRENVPSIFLAKVRKVNKTRKLG